MTLTKAAIRGIPNPRDYGDIEKLTPGELADLFVQRHLAHRAGEHFDYRIGTPQTGLYSWSTKPTRLPEPGQKRFFRQQPKHSHPYGYFSGTIGEGYGKGTVKREKKERILVHHADPEKIEFTIASTRMPERFVLLKPKKWKNREWLLYNITPTEGPDVEKVHFKPISADQVEPLIDKMQEGTSVQAKLDGASSLVKVLKNGAEVLSYRKHKDTGYPIVHTERMYGKRPKFDVPKDLEGTILKGEIYGEKDLNGEKEVIPPQELGGVLNATIENALRKKDKDKINLKNLIFDIAQYGKQPIDYKAVPYSERRRLVEDVVGRLPEAANLELPEEAKTTDEAKRMWSDILEGKHPLTREGVVIHPPTGKPLKAKKRDETDVFIKDITPGTGKYRNAAGAIHYSLTPEGEPVGKVGTGLSDELRRDLWKNRQSYTGRRARIISQEQHPSGAFRAPALVAIHEDY